MGVRGGLEPRRADSGGVGGFDTVPNCGYISVKFCVKTETSFHARLCRDIFRCAALRSPLLGHPLCTQEMSSLAQKLAKKSNKAAVTPAVATFAAPVPKYDDETDLEIPICPHY